MPLTKIHGTWFSLFSISRSDSSSSRFTRMLALSSNTPISCAPISSTRCRHSADTFSGLRLRHLMGMMLWLQKVQRYGQPRLVMMEKLRAPSTLSVAGCKLV